MIGHHSATQHLVRTSEISLQFHVLKFLKLFLTDAIINTFVDNTNAYAANMRRIGWTVLTYDKLWRFIAITLLMGVFKLPQRTMYWDSPIIKSLFISNIMTCKRYCDILLCPHWIDTSVYNEAQRKGKRKHNPFDSLMDLCSNWLKYLVNCLSLGRSLILMNSAFHSKVLMQRDTLMPVDLINSISRCFQ